MTITTGNRALGKTELGNTRLGKTGLGKTRLGVALVALALTGCDAISWDRNALEKRNQQVSAAPAKAAPRIVRALTDPALLRDVRAIERRVGGRLGVMLVSPDRQLVIAHRDRERFPICSTYKLPLAVMLLSDVDAGKLALNRNLALGDRPLVDNSPVLERLKADGQSEISVADALGAMMTRSDNSAANLLLSLVGDNSGYSRRIEAAFGNDSIRMDRSEGVLNEDAAKREDTATPDAMIAVLARVFHGDILSAASTRRLAGLMRDASTGTARVRAGLPDWLTAGDKTGTCTRTYNSVGWIDVGRGEKPYLYAVYLDETTAGEDQAEAALADVGRLFGRVIEARYPVPETGGGAAAAR